MRMCESEIKVFLNTPHRTIVFRLSLLFLEVMVWAWHLEQLQLQQ
jgi:hypothetical protein